MCDIVFLTPTAKINLNAECTGTLLLATILKQKGINVDIYRFYESDESKGFDSFVEETANNILAKEPRIVSFYCRCDCFLADIRIAQRVKTINKDITVIFGGPQADAVSDLLLDEIPEVDYCCSGEGEETIYPLVSGILSGGDVTGIDGLTYRNDEGKSVTNPRPALKQSLDELPFVDYSLVPEETIQDTVNNNKSFPVEVGRGCPFNCAFCSTCLFWKRKFRIKTSGRIIEEIEEIKDLYGVSKFSFLHDLFTAKKQNVLEFCKYVKESGNNIKWMCSSRIDTLDEETIDAMASSGLTGVYFGIETGSPRMQKITHKNLKIPQVIDVCKMLTDRDVRITASFIYGFPEETEEDLEQTLQLMRKLMEMGVTSLQLHLCAIFPGTEYFEKYKEELVFADNYSDQVSDFGVKENFEFITSHSDLFPFYYEYHNEHREKFALLSDYALKCINLYNTLLRLDSARYEEKTLVQIYLDLMEANKELISGTNEVEGEETETSLLVDNYLASVGYSEEELRKLREIFAFINDERRIYGGKEDAMEVKNYGADIKAFYEKKGLAEISATPTMVVFRKIGKDLSLVFRPGM
ncbi:MAG: radical SAM protein [Ruminococcus sp.]|nr:radical SAM protein [Ruminococcus sp.]